MASMTLSLAGIAVSLLTVVILVAAEGFQVSQNLTADGNETLYNVRMRQCRSLVEICRRMCSSIAHRRKHTSDVLPLPVRRR